MTLYKLFLIFQIFSANGEHLESATWASNLSHTDSSTCVEEMADVVNAISKDSKSENKQVEFRLVECIPVFTKLPSKETS